MLNEIRKKLRLIDITEDALERRHAALQRLVRPIFAAAWGGDRSPSVEEILINEDTVSIGYRWRFDDCVEYVKIPSEIFETADPVKAAAEWRIQSQAQKKVNEKAALKRELQERLARLLEEENEMD